MSSLFDGVSEALPLFGWSRVDSAGSAASPDCGYGIRELGQALLFALPTPSAEVVAQRPASPVGRAASNQNNKEVSALGLPARFYLRDVVGQRCDLPENARNDRWTPRAAAAETNHHSRPVLTRRSREALDDAERMELSCGLFITWQAWPSDRPGELVNSKACFAFRIELLDQRRQELGNSSRVERHSLPGRVGVCLAGRNTPEPPHTCRELEVATPGASESVHDNSVEVARALERFAVTVGEDDVEVACTRRCARHVALFESDCAELGNYERGGIALHLVFVDQRHQFGLSRSSSRDPGDRLPQEFRSAAEGIPANRGFNGGGGFDRSEDPRSQAPAVIGCTPPATQWHGLMRTVPPAPASQTAD